MTDPSLTPHQFVISDGRLVGRIGGAERELLQQLLASVAGMLEIDYGQAADPLADLVGWDEQARVPKDPALRRLLPDGVRDDAETALEFRRLSERSLRQGKASALKAAAVLLESSELRLSRDQAEILARAFNDVRLVLAERLHLHTAEDVEKFYERVERLNSVSPEVEEIERAAEDGLMQLYRFITYLHGRLVTAMLELLRSGDAAQPSQDQRPGQ